MASTSPLGGFNSSSNLDTPTSSGGYRIMALPDFSKVVTGVRLPLPAQ